MHSVLTFKSKLILEVFFVQREKYSIKACTCIQKCYYAKSDLRSCLCDDEYSCLYSIISSSFCRNDNIENSLDSYRNAFDIVYLVSLNALKKGRTIKKK